MVTLRISQEDVSDDVMEDVSDDVMEDETDPSEKNLVSRTTKIEDLKRIKLISYKLLIRLLG